MPLAVFAFSSLAAPSALVRTTKAALLYADEVTVDTTGLLLFPKYVVEGPRRSPLGGVETALRHLSVEETIADLLPARDRGVLQVWPELSDRETTLVDVDLEAVRRTELWQAVRRGIRSAVAEAAAAEPPEPLAVLPPDAMADVLSSLQLRRLERLLSTRLIPAFAHPGDSEHLRLLDPSWHGNADAVETSLATALLGALPAFPNAEIDVILDVRDRLAEARARFRAAMAMAVDRFQDVPAKDFDDEVDRFRRTYLEPAGLDIRDMLRELGVVPTLQRVASDRAAVPTAAALAVAGIMLDATAVTALATSGTGVAAAAKELATRRGIRGEMRRLPYLYLHQVDAELRSSRR